MTALMDFISTRRFQLATDSWQHISATVQAVLIATLLSVALGVAVYRSRSGSAIATGLAATALTVPSFALRMVLGEFAEQITASQRVVPTALLEAGFTFRHPDVASVTGWLANA